MIPDIIIFPGGEVWISASPGSLDFILLEVIRAEGYSPPRSFGFGSRSGRSSTGRRGPDRFSWGYDNHAEGQFDRPDYYSLTKAEKAQAKQDFYAKLWGKK